MCGSDRDLNEVVIYHSSVSPLCLFLVRGEIRLGVLAHVSRGHKMLFRELHMCQKLL